VPRWPLPTWCWPPARRWPRRVRGAAGRRLQLLPNGADARHFRPGGPVPGSWECAEAAALRRAIAMPPGAPVLGHAGVVDERVDLPLLAALADARPGWQFVMLGPVVKIDAAALPRRPNLHWLGEQPHRVLPGLVAHWQAALLPWADHLATRHASPVRLLEALAAGLPAVATRLPGTVALCAAADPAQRVRLVLPGPVDRSLADWLAACEAALADRRSPPPLPRALHWDRIAQQADGLLAGLGGAPDQRLRASS
jgi:glycosyltransferase involved in cell wall biosynthesis